MSLRENDEPVDRLLRFLSLSGGCLAAFLGKRRPIIGAAALQAQGAEL